MSLLAPLPYVVISDIHFFHRRTPTTHIIDSFWQWLSMHEATIRKCKVFFLAGDIYDRFIPSHYPDIQLVNQFFLKFGLWLARHGIHLSVLRGTIIHDRGQFSAIIPILTAAGVSFSYHSTVEVCIHLGTSVLYVPDNWHHDPKVVAADAAAAVANAGVDQVDIAIMHGSFEYQLPMMKHGNLDQAEFEKLVKYSIHIGHVHQRTHKGKVYAQGSFDRVEHEKQMSKGGDAVIGGKYLRLDNPFALPYVTIDLIPGVVDANLELIQSTVEKMQYHGWLRLRADRYHPLFEHFPTLQPKYPFVKMERQYQTTKAVNASPVHSTKISQGSILDSLQQYKPDITKDALQMIESLLTEVTV